MTMPSDPQRFAQYLWPPHPGVLQTCTHEPEVPMLCAMHPWVGLRCRPCLISHVADVDLSHDFDTEATCSQCGEPAPVDPVIVASKPLFYILLSHDTMTVLHPTAPLLLENFGIYTGDVLLRFDHWLCTNCMEAQPPDFAWLVPISPSVVADP